MRALLLLFLTASCLADTVTMKDGTFLKGRIERIASGVLEMRVPALGEANVQRLQLALVESIVTEDAVLVSSAGVVSRGPANAAGGRVASQGGVETSLLDVALELWRDPSLRVGVSNDYRSKPLPTQVKTDTAYFLRTTYVWK